jgi:hypothetical protein
MCDGHEWVFVWRVTSNLSQAKYGLPVDYLRVLIVTDATIDGVSHVIQSSISHKHREVLEKDEVLNIF